MSSITSLGGTRYLVVCTDTDGTRYYAIVDQATIITPVELSAAHGPPATLLTALVAGILAVSGSTMHSCNIGFVRTAPEAACIASLRATGVDVASQPWVIYQTMGAKIIPATDTVCLNGCLCGPLNSIAYFTAAGDAAAATAVVNYVKAYYSIP
jgi:hypothetical protein